MIYLATNNGLVVANPEGDWRVTGHGLDGHNVTAVMAREGVTLAGTTDGIYRSDDGGKTWREASAGLGLRHVRGLAYHPDISDCEFAGTEPAGIFLSRDGGEIWQECEEVARLRDRYHWSLPYSPEAGCVRGFAFHGRRAYAAVEVGGALCSYDGGESWRLVEGSDGRPNFGQPAERLIHPDVHSIYVHPSSPELVYAPTGGGFYRSLDGGDTWRCFYACYVRAAWIDPSDTQHILLGPADGVDRNGRIEETWDGGENWQLAAQGLAVPWTRHMVERFIPVGEELAAVLSNGEVVARPLQGGPWRRVVEEIRGVNALAVE